MGVFIGVLVLLISVTLVVLLALSEWYDFDLGSSTQKAVTAAVPALAVASSKPVRATKAKAKAAPARRSAAAKRR